MSDPGSEAGFVVVPDRPGQLLRPTTAPARPRDDLDEVIDELLPSVDGGPGAFDAVLVAAGLALLAWAALAGGPSWALAVGIISLGLGVVLPVRAAARAARDRRRRRGHQALAAQGTPLDASTPVVGRLVAAHDRLVATAAAAPPDLAGTALGAAHDATLEVAALLGGRPPNPGPEASYVAARAEAVEDLAEALAGYRPSGDPALDDLVIDPDLRVRAYEELDALGGPTSLSRLEDVRNDPRLPRSEPG